MWLRHFLRVRRTKKYKAFKERYYEFHPDDCYRICTWHHEEIHVLYMPIIKQLFAHRGKAAANWTWEEAEDLMNRLRKFCDGWILRETKGMKPSERRG